MYHKKKRSWFPKRILFQEAEELKNHYQRTRLKGYIEVGVSFLLFIIIGKIIMELYDLIPMVGEEIGFFMTQSIIVIMVVTGVLICVEAGICGRMRKIERNQIDIMCQLRCMEADMDIMNSLAERLNLIRDEKK